MPSPDKAHERPVHGDVCSGCGRYHGSLNERLDCLERKLKEARQDIEDLGVLVANAR